MKRRYTRKARVHPQPWYLWEDREAKDEENSTSFGHLARKLDHDELHLSELSTTDLTD